MAQSKQDAQRRSKASEGAAAVRRQNVHLFDHPFRIEMGRVFRMRFQ